MIEYPGSASSPIAPYWRKLLEDRVADILTKTGIRPDRLELEVSEWVLVEDTASTAAALCRLRRLGIRLAIDDFGTGYSWLIYLPDLAIDTSKIDGSFIVRLGRDRGSLAIVRAMVGLSHELGVTVIAEGIETEQHVSDVRALGIDHGQGYYFSKPVPPDDIPAHIRAVEPASTNRQIVGSDRSMR